jgi:hypothetical protein
LARRWGDRDHIRIPSGSIIRDRKPNPRFKIKHEGDPENFAEKEKLLTAELEDTVKNASRNDKPVAGENVFIVLTTTKPISKEHVVSSKIFHFFPSNDRAFSDCIY